MGGLGAGMGGERYTDYIGVNHTGDADRGIRHRNLAEHSRHSATFACGGQFCFHQVLLLMRW